MERGKLAILLGILLLILTFFSYTGGYHIKGCQRYYYDCTTSVKGCEPHSYNLGCQTCNTMNDCSNLQCQANEYLAWDVSGVGGFPLVSGQAPPHYCTCLSRN